MPASTTHEEMSWNTVDLAKDWGVLSVDGDSINDFVDRLKNDEELLRKY